MKTIATSIDIAAPPASVWAVLADFARYGDWNPFIHPITGQLLAGARLDVTITPPGGKVMRFKPVVEVAEADRELRWRGSLLLPGLFDGTHHFRLEPITGGTRFVHGEAFRGLLVPLLPASLYDRARTGFVAMNEALKARAEGLR